MYEVKTLLFFDKELEGTRTAYEGLSLGAHNHYAIEADVFIRLLTYK